MAGKGSRFVSAGFAVAKPFINVCGITMIERVLDNLRIDNARYILIARKEHILFEESCFKRLRDNYKCEIITVDNITEGAACTILLSCWFINNDNPLLLANSDQIVEINIADFINDSVDRKLDGSLLTFPACHPKWSYAKIDNSGYLVELREKKVISQYATVGLYYYQRGKDFVNSAVQMISNNDRINNEFYTAPAYNYSVKNGLRIGIYNIEGTQMFGLGTPEDLNAYIEHVGSFGVKE
jgi:dTDP-glucose pyrophosphorylase